MDRMSLVFAIICFTSLARGAPPCEVQANLPPLAQSSAARAWMRCPAESKSSSDSAWAWASVPLKVSSAGAESPLHGKPLAADLGYRWKPSANGREMHLVQPGKCDGRNCTPDKLIGGWSNGAYRPWDGRRWGESTASPVQIPDSSRAAAAKPSSREDSSDFLGN